MWFFPLSIMLSMFSSGVSFAKALKTTILVGYGDFHGNEMPFKDGDEVYSLYELTDKRFELYKQKVKIEPFQDMYDKETEKTGRRLSTNEKKDGELRLFLKGDFKIGTVQSVGDLNFRKCLNIPDAMKYASSDVKTLVKKLPSCRVKFQNHEYVFKAETLERFNVEADQFEFLFTVNISWADKKQTLELMHDFYWVGDLNRDGYLDFLTSNSGHTKQSVTQLHLSAKSAKGIVKKVASSTNTGC
jgi:hypothetical protein